MAQGGETFEIVRGSEVLNLTDMVNERVNSVALVDFEGLGMAPVQNFEQAGPSQDGATFVGLRLLPRNIRMTVLCQESTPAKFHARRERLLQMCKPSRTQSLILRWTFADGRVRQMDCRYAGGLDMPSNSSGRWGTWGLRDVITLRAEKPTWYNPDGYSRQFSMSYSASGHTYPEVYPTPYGTTSVDATENIQMADPAAWDSSPLIVATGLLTNLIITNVTTGDKLDFSPNSIPSGAIWTINTRYGEASITDDAGANQISKLSDDSNLTTWRLAPGDNVIHVTATVLDASANFLILGNDQLIGQ